MKIKKTDRKAVAAKASALKRLIGKGMLLEGSLNAMMRGGSEHWQLTDKAGGKTRTLYVPARHVEEVTDALLLWKQVRAALKDLSTAVREAYANAFAEGRAVAPRGRPPKANASGCGVSPRRGSASKGAKRSAIPKDGPASVPLRTPTLRKR